MPDLDEFEQAIVNQWSEIHKRSALVHVLLVALEEGPKWSAELVSFIDDATSGDWGVDERSLYRALRRLEHSGLVRHTKQSVAGTGANRKVFELTASGRRVLAEYERSTLSYHRRLDTIRRIRRNA